MALIASGNLSPKGLCVLTVVLSTPLGVTRHRHTAQALIDSGAELTAVRASLATQLHLPTDGVDDVRDAFGVVRTCFTSACSLLFYCDDDGFDRTENFTITSQVAVVDGAIEFEHGCDLIIGASTLDGFRLIVDYADRNFRIER